MTRKQAANASIPGTAQHIHYDLIIEKLEIARTIGLVTDYLVSPIEPPEHLRARVTVCHSANATDDGLIKYIARLLDGLVSAQDILLTPSFATAEMRVDDLPQRQPTQSINTFKSMRSVLFPRTVHLQRLAAVGAMLTCVAVVLNVGPFAKAPDVGSSLFHRAGSQEPPATPEQPNGFTTIPPRKFEARTLPNDSPSAEEPKGLSEAIRVLMRPSPFSVADAGPAAFQTSGAKDGGVGVDLSASVSPSSAAHIPGHANAERPAIVGVWAPNTGACSAHDFQHGVLPTVITTEGAWAGETFCMFTKRKETEKGWTVVAKCSGSRERWMSKVRLTVTENRLTWASKRGTQAYTRCRPDILMAQAR
jgi:hypothetical protein